MRMGCYKYQVGIYVGIGSERKRDKEHYRKLLRGYIFCIKICIIQ